MNKILLIIGKTNPEPATTAAGGRMMQLISIWLEEGYQIVFGSTSKPTKHSADLNSLGITTIELILNDSSFNSFIAELNPSLVVFDRFTSEEQFGWRIAEVCPNAIRILDTEDLHFLRKAREEAIKQSGSLDHVNLYSEIAKREIASILRCDLSLIISDYEMQLLKRIFNLSDEILHYLPFMVTPLVSEERQKQPSFAERSGFITIGNMLHGPNSDSVKYLKTTIWPEIRNRLPKANLHVFGAYESQQIREMHDPKNGFFIEGWASEVSSVMKTARVCLAPLRFGAGIKGKILDSMMYGTPCVTTSIGAEGMKSGQDFSGYIADDVTHFVKASVCLYSEKEKWEKFQQTGFTNLKQLFSREVHSGAFINRLNALKDNLVSHRKNNFIGQILTHQSLQSTKYMSKWIEAKNKIK